MNYKDGKHNTALFIGKWFERTQPALAFEGGTEADFESWQHALKAKVRELLLDFPKPAPLSPELYGKEECPAFVREKWVIQTEQDCFMPLYLLVPHERQHPAPAILCCHGHGPCGKDPVAGVHFDDPARRANIAQHNYNYGEQMAQRGFVTIVPDWRSFGERIAYSSGDFGGRDTCNIHFLQHLLMGRTLLGANVFDAMRAIDFLLTRDEVDHERIGCMGLSFGGTMTTYTTLLDDRIKAADIICYATTTAHYSIHCANTCGSQLVPGLYQYADVGHVIGAIAPRPLLIESGTSDMCFEFHSAREAHGIVRRIYEAAGAEDKLEIDAFPGGHAFAGNKAFSFFARHLQNPPADTEQKDPLDGMRLA